MKRLLVIALICLSSTIVFAIDNVVKSRDCTARYTIIYVDIYGNFLWAYTSEATASTCSKAMELAKAQ